MSDLRLLLQRIEHFRQKLDQMETGSTMPGGAVESPPWFGGLRPADRTAPGPPHTSGGESEVPAKLHHDDPQVPLPAGPCDRTSLSMPTAELLFWREQCQMLRQRWEKYDADGITTRWRHSGNPRCEHHNRTGELLSQWEHWLAHARISTAACEQLRQCLQERLRRFETALAHEQRQEEWRSRLSQCYLSCLKDGALKVAEVAALAEELLADAQQGQPIKWEPVGEIDPGTYGIDKEMEEVDRQRIVMCHQVASYAIHLTQVSARMILHDAEWRVHPLPVLTAALLADIGWLTIPESIIGKSLRQWSEEEWQAVKEHPLRGAELLARTAPELAALVPVIAAHHERIDGSGYPHQRRGEAIPALARILAVADAYVARRVPWIDDAIRDSRQALTEVLLEAEQGQLDDHAVTLLARLSFYPTGTLVELSDGSAAVVLAPPACPADPRTAHRPLVARLTTADGKPLSCPELLPLSGNEQGVVVRPLPPARILMLLRYFPDLQ